MPPAGGVSRLWFVHRRPVLVLLLLLASASSAIGLWNGSRRSQDFQYSGERVLLDHGDPWAEYLAGDPKHHFALTQIPNYLALLYVFLVPYGLLAAPAARVAWALTNLLFAMLSARWTAACYGMRGGSAVAIVCLLLMSTPARNTLGNGQQSLLVLFLWALMLRLQTNAKPSIVYAASVLGTSYFKFTFGPPVLLFVLFRWGRRAAVLTALPAMAGVVLVWLWLFHGHTPHALLSLATEPLTVARTGFKPEPNDPNLMNVTELALGRLPASLRDGAELALALSVCLPLSWFSFRRHREAGIAWHMAMLGTMSYCLFKHHAYDGVILLFPFCFGLRHWETRAGQAIAAIVAYFFFGERLLDAAHLHPWWFCVPDLLLLVAVLVMVWRLALPHEKALERRSLVALPA